MWERYYNPYRLDFNSVPASVKNESTTSLLPTQIVIPDLKINLPVVPTKITNSHWPITSDGVSYLSASARPGNIGNSIYYGHNWPRLLGNLYKIKIGHIIKIYTSGGTNITYIVDEIKRVSPSDTSVLTNTSLRRLTLYTCTGLADSQRLVVIAHAQDRIN
jgi:LPXTG-site transpeptidase (sortase) family protein